MYGHTVVLYRFFAQFCGFVLLEGIGYIAVMFVFCFAPDE